MLMKSIAYGTGGGWSRVGAGLRFSRAVIMLRHVFSIGVRVAAGGFAIGVVGLVGGFFLFLSTVPRSGEAVGEQADGIVVLTGGAQRVDGALSLLAGGHARRLLVSGVYEKTTRAQLAVHNPDAAKLFSCCVDLDYRARNTIGNAIETRRWAKEHDFRSIIVVTSNYHMPRALVELRSILQDYDIKPYAVVTGSVDPDAWWRSATSARLLMAEYGKYLVALVRTRLETDPELAPIRLMAGGRKPLLGDVYVR